MIWYEVSVSTNRYGSDIVADFFRDLGSDVSIYDPEDIDEIIDSNKTYLQGEHYDSSLYKGNDVRCCGYFVVDQIDEILTKINEKIQYLKDNSFEDVGTLEVKYKYIDDPTKWQENWKKFYARQTVGKFQIVPEWLVKPADYKKGNMSIIIRPGMAFGTGDHETTRLVLQSMSNIKLQNQSVLDVGSGSGILAIAASKKGAEEVIAIEIDEKAVDNARENYILNFPSEDGNIHYICGDISRIKKSNNQYFLITANITADVLINISNEIVKLLHYKGSLILSGVIKTRLDEVIHAYSKFGLKVSNVTNENDWCCIILQNSKSVYMRG